MRSARHIPDGKTTCRNVPRLTFRDYVGLDHLPRARSTRNDRPFDAPRVRSRLRASGTPEHPGTLADPLVSPARRERLPVETFDSAIALEAARLVLEATSE